MYVLRNTDNLKTGCVTNYYFTGNCRNRYADRLCKGTARLFTYSSAGGASADKYLFLNGYLNKINTSDQITLFTFNTLWNLNWVWFENIAIALYCKIQWIYISFLKRNLSLLSCTARCLERYYDVWLRDCLILLELIFKSKNSVCNISRRFPPCHSPRRRRKIRTRKCIFQRAFAEWCVKFVLLLCPIRKLMASRLLIYNLVTLHVTVRQPIVL